MLRMLFCSQNKLGKVNSFELRFKPQNKKRAREGHSALGIKEIIHSDGLNGFESIFRHGKRIAKNISTKMRLLHIHTHTHILG